MTLNFYDKNSRKIYETSFVIFFFNFWIILILSSLFSESIGTSIRTSIFYFRFGFLVLIVNYLLVYEEKFIKYFFYSLGITLLVLTLYTFFQIFFLNNAVDPNRISGLFGEELIQGSYFIRMLPIFLGLIYLTKMKLKSKNKILLTSIFIGVFIILLSGERSSKQVYLYFFFFTLLFFPLSLKKKFLITSMISIFIIFLIIFLMEYEVELLKLL